MSYQFSPDTFCPPSLGTTLPPKRRVGRFAETPGVRLLRRFYRVACAVAPGLAARLAYDQLAKPPRTVPRDWQLVLRRHATHRRVPFGRGELSTYEWGEGPTVLMVHGWGSHALHMGRMVMPLVHAGFRVVAFDAPAHGLSSGRTTDLLQFPAAIAAVAARHGRLHGVVGHSFGASMALLAQRDWGVDTSRMVLISSFEHCNWFVEAFGEHVGLTPQVVARVRDLQARRYGGRLDWSRMSVVDMARHAPVSALIVHDEDDEEIPFEHSLSIAAAMKDVEFKATTGYGHHLVVRNLDVIHRVVDFISR
jgi:pimeloyl-ACP methyl ester carboxylesterase